MLHPDIQYSDISYNIHSYVWYIYIIYLATSLHATWWYTLVKLYNEKLDGVSMISYISIVFMALYRILYICTYYIASYIHEAYNVAQILVVEGLFICLNV